MNIHQALTKGFQSLQDSSLSPQLDAEVLLSHAIKKDRTWILTNSDYELTSEQDKRFQEFINRRKKSEPVAYITGHKEFFKRNFEVNKSVLIPRPETEQLIELVLSDLKSEQIITDIGTGSGCIAITLALESPKSQIYALDISDEALKIAEKNRQKYSVDNLIVAKSELLSYLSDNSIKPDVIVANLPYLAQADIDDSPTKVDLSHEPSLALLAGDDRMALIHQCVKQAVGILTEKGKIYLEMLPEQISSFLKWITFEELPYTAHAYPDLNGRERFVVLKKA